MKYLNESAKFEPRLNSWILNTEYYDTFIKLVSEDPKYTYLKIKK